jgi:putative membrane protein
MTEIHSSQLASKSRCRHQALCRKDGERSPADLAELKSLIDGGKVHATLPTALDAEHQKILDALKATHGKQFNQVYDDQVEAHELPHLQ